MECYLFDEPTYFFFTSDLPQLLYYSHVPTTIIALFVGLFVFFNARHLLLNRLLLLISLCFSGWTLISLIAWTNIHGDLILFTWPLFGVFQALISVFSIYFIYVFLNKRDVGFTLKLLFLALLTPVLIFAHTDVSVSGFNLAACDSFGYEGLAYKIYYTGLGFLAMGWIGALLIAKYRKAEGSFRKQIVLMGIGIESFLFSFSFFTFIATYLAGLGIFPDSSLELYGLFGMTIFMIFMSILIVQFRAFNAGITTSSALIVALVILIGSQFTFAPNNTSKMLTAITLIVTGVTGILLIRSVKKEIAQRKEIERLAQHLEQANTRLKALDKQKSEFVSIASHQLRSPLTAVRGYASLLLDGDYGPLPQNAIEPLQRIEKSSRLMTYAIEDYLNVSRIESGNMKYNYSDFNLKDEVEHICDDLRQDAIKNGLSLIFRSDLMSRGIIHADLGKTVQIVQNLIHNSIKYTKEGSIKVLVRDDVVRKKIHVDIIDTGIGMNKETLLTIFQKFERADNANSVNVHGTGLGLYVAKMMTEAMGGEVKAASDGDGKGSCFTITFPLAL